MFSESERDAVHAAFDKIVANVLQDRSKEPTELGATGVVERCAEKSRERTEQSFCRLCVEGLVHPRSNALDAKPIGLHTRRGRSEVGRCCRERRRRGKHARSDGVLLREEALHQGAPCLRVLERIAGYVADSFLNVAMYADDVAVGKSMRERNLRFDEFVAIEQTEFVRDW